MLSKFGLDGRPNLCFWDKKALHKKPLPLSGFLDSTLIRAFYYSVFLWLFFLFCFFSLLFPSEKKEKRR